MALRDLQSDLTNLDFGKGTAFDRPNQGFSNHPFVTSEVINTGVQEFDSFSDPLVRGGLIMATARSIKDVERITKFLLTPQGVGFLTKQVGLQSSNPQIRKGESIFNDPASNQRTYNLGVNTLASVLGSAAGIRFKREGTTPLSDPNKFEGYINDLELTKENSSNNRLIELLDNHIINFDPKNNILNEYNGGPDSVYGLGKTTINKYLDQRTTFGSQLLNQTDDFTVSQDPASDPNTTTEDEGIDVNMPSVDIEPVINQFPFEKLKPPRDIGGRVNQIKKHKPISEYHVNLATNAFKSLKKNLNAQSILPNRSNYDGIKDFIPFRFEAVNTENPTQSDYIVFKAFLDSFNDNYNAEHNSFNYNGRGETFYTYNGFTRNIDFSFKIAAQSKNELKPLYQKLNYLLSNTAPDYSKVGRMRTPFIKLTVGDWCSRLPGVLNSIGLTWQKDYSWDIGTGDNTSVLILPHILDVNCSFTPIHQFMPEKLPITSDGSQINIPKSFINA